MRLSKILTTSPSSRARQSGFTLVEILIALALITLLAVGISLSFDGSRSRAEALISNMSEIAAGNVRLKNDMGCYTSAAAGLLDPAKAQANNYCGLTSSTTWNGPYVGQFTPDPATKLAVEFDKVAQGVTIQYASNQGGANPFGASGTNYYVEASNVPYDIVQQALQECNGTTTPVGTQFDGVKCSGSAVQGGVGTFDMLYDQTR